MRPHDAPTLTPASRRLVLAAMLLALLASSVTFDGSRDRPVPQRGIGATAGAVPSAGGGAQAGSERDLRATVEFPPVGVQQARVRVDGVHPDAVEPALRVEGVSFATLIATADEAVAEPGGGVLPLKVAVVDPAGFRVLTPQITADAVDLWVRLSEGDAVFTHEFAQRALLQLGTNVPLSSGAAMRVGGFGTTVTPPVADAIVTPATAQRLGLSVAMRALLVAVAPGVRPEAVAHGLERELGAAAHVVTDPRAPRPVALEGRITADNVWDWLAQCESGGDWHINTGNGYYGGLQFLPESWFLVGGAGMPHEASREEQINRARLLYALQGWEAWPVCSILLGLRPGPLPERYRRGPAADTTPSPATGPIQPSHSPSPQASPSDDGDASGPGPDLPPLPTGAPGNPG